MTRAWGSDATLESPLQLHRTGNFVEGIGCQNRTLAPTMSPRLRWLRNGQTAIKRLNNEIPTYVPAVKWKIVASFVNCFRVNRQVGSDDGSSTCRRFDNAQPIALFGGRQTNSSR